MDNEYTLRVKKERQISPPEADPIARELRAVADELARHHSALLNALEKLDQTWDGESKDHFDQRAGNPPAALEEKLMNLRRMAAKIDQIKVTIEEWETIPYQPRTYDRD